jgi:CheY-like chemotaxis protein
VIVNLVLNARDAMPQGGRIQLDVRNSEPARRERPDAITVPDRNVRITVADSGHGMDEATRSRVFDPFFTTKGLGRATGLGLATVFGVVTQSGGAIQVESALGVGTRFIVDLPGETAPIEVVPTPVAESGIADAVGIPGGLAILLVDDEPAIREIGRRTLERAGHRVRVASSAEDALAQIARGDQPVDVVVTDVVMPGMHGPELAERLRAHAPKASIVLMSGYAQDVIEGAGHVFDGFLAKPFEPARLLEIVARVGRARTDRLAVAGATTRREDALEPVDAHVEGALHGPSRGPLVPRRPGGARAHAPKRGSSDEHVGPATRRTNSSD